MDRQGRTRTGKDAAEGRQSVPLDPEGKDAWTGKDAAEGRQSVPLDPEGKDARTGKDAAEGRQSVSVGASPCLSLSSFDTDWAVPTEKQVAACLS